MLVEFLALVLSATYCVCCSYEVGRALRCSTLFRYAFSLIRGTCLGAGVSSCPECLSTNKHDGEPGTPSGISAVPSSLPLQLVGFFLLP